MNNILSDITVHMKYAKYNPELNRRETWSELVDRNIAMHKKKYPELIDQIDEAYKYVYDKKILPSMRSLQFAGKPIEISPNRLYNCSYLPADHTDCFSEVMFLLLSGCGVGYSVQQHHIKDLPNITKPFDKRTRRFVIGDSIEGWSDAIKVLIKSYLGSKRSSKVKFDYSDIRPKGARLVTSGGKAPGPQPLKECLVKIKGILDGKQEGSKLSTLEVHDIVCHIADAVLAGGIRRAALISLFSAYDEEMISCKSGNWWETNPQRGRANNSAVLMRHKITKEFFLDLWKRIELSGAGEPGIYFNHDKDWGTNPCCEIALRPYQFCNLCEVNVSDVTSQEDLNERVKAASFIGTLQAGYTEFHYLREIWQETTEKDALIGI
jgi:ribonucleoside-triphosphate reductase